MKPIVLVFERGVSGMHNDPWIRNPYELAGYILRSAKPSVDRLVISYWPTAPGQLMVSTPGISLDGIFQSEVRALLSFGVNIEFSAA